ncbi:resuscitation-promoting factor, partial [Rhodococcus sp. IEGM 1351]|nr:resuscitation-promoting factor [Rhodococcus sp. IEGM 1351]
RHKNVTLDVDGDKIALSTMTTSVDAARSDAGYSISDRDVGAPERDATLSDGDTVGLRRAREVSLTVDG